MLLRLRNAVASMTAMVRQQERTANNLANANTVGYKRDRIFTETLAEHLDTEGAPRSTRRTAQRADLRQGNLEATGNPLDVSLGSDGFLVLTDVATGASRYTRAGRFVLGHNGLLQTPDGHTVEGMDGPIVVPPDSGPIEISRTGEVRAGNQDLGQLRVVRFADPTALQRLDGAAFAAPGLLSAPVEVPVVLQGQIETSNVDPMTEMTEMIMHFRLFESQQKMLQTTDQILGQVTRNLGTF